MKDIMKKLLFLFLLSILAYGCTQIQTTPVTDATTTSVFVSEETTTSIESLEPGLYKLRISEEVIFEDRVIKVLDINSGTGIVKLNVDGQEIELEQTKKGKLIKGLEIETQRLDYGTTTEEHVVTLKVSKFILEEGDYLVKLNQELTFTNKDLKVTDLTTKDTIRVSVILANNRLTDEIEIGNTKTVNGLTITNKRVFNEITRADKRVVVTVVEAY